MGRKAYQLPSDTTPDPTGLVVVSTPTGDGPSVAVPLSSLNGNPAYVLVSAYNAPSYIKNISQYVCDGVNDNVEIQNAIDYLSSIGGLVVLSPGNFYLSSTVNISAVSGVAIKGYGWSTIVKINNSMDDYAITFAPTTSGVCTSIENMLIDCNGGFQSGGGGIYAHGAIQCLFRGIHIYRPWGNGIHFYQDGNGGTGHHNRVIHCLFDHGEDSNGGDGRAIRIEASDENMIMMSDFETNGRPAASEPNHIFDRSGLNHFIGNSFVTGMTGIKVENLHSRIIGNIFDGCQGHQVRLNGNGNIVSANTFHNIGFGPVDCDGIWVDNVVNNSIEGNIFDTYDSGTKARSAINFANGATNNIVANNQLLHNGVDYSSAAIIPGTGNIIGQNYPTTFDNLIAKNITTATPASAGATGIAGQVQYDSSYIYVCTAANTWKRVSIAGW